MPRKTVNQMYDYVLDYIREAAIARRPLREIVNRAVRAYKQQPLHNTYKENAERWKQNVANSNPELESYYDQLCNSIPDSTNDTVFNAVETFVSMAMGGASQFEYEPADDSLEKDPVLVDRLAELAKFFHDENHIDALVPKATRKMVQQGQANFYLKPIDGGSRFQVSLIDAYKMLHDPRSSKTNRCRFDGFTEIESWETVKDNIYKTKDGYFLKNINNVDSYLNDIRNWGLPNNALKWEDELRFDLDTFRSIYGINVAKPSESKDKDGKTANPSSEPGYKGDDVEVSYLWDTISHIYFVVINRRFIVQAKKDPFKKKLQVEYINSKGETDTKDITVEIDSPLVTVPFIDADWETFPVSPLFYCLDDFDAICSMESVMNHNFSIMAPITFQSTSYDAEQMSMLGQVAGQIVEGTMNTLGVMPKTHDMSPIMAAIERREQRIKRMLGATDQFELQAMIGNRATASEVTAMSGAVSQRMNAPLANIECGMSELIQKMFAMYIIFAKDDDLAFPFKGGVATVNKTDMLGRSLIQAKLKSRIKIEEQEQSRNALMVLQTLVGLQSSGVDQINREAVVTTLVPMITLGTVNRRQAASFLNHDDQIDPLMVQQANQELAQQQMPEGYIDPSMTEGMSPEDMDAILQGVQGGIDSAQQPIAPATTPTVDTGVMNDQAGLENNVNALGGLI